MTIREQLFAVTLASIAVWLILSFDWQDWLIGQRGRNLINSCEDPRLRSSESLWADGKWLYREYVYACDDGTFIATRHPIEDWDR